MTSAPIHRPDANWSDERGAMAIMIAVCMLMLAGFAMIVVDVGALYEERRDLQNGADAAALAVAIDCAQGINCSSAAAQPLADQYASANSNDGASTVNSSDITFDGNEVTVVARTEDAGPNIDGDTSTVDHWFARLFGHFGSAVEAQASARWGTPGSLAALPITFSICEWSALTGDGVTFPTAIETIYFHNADQQGGGPNGDPDDCIYGPGQDADGDGDNGYGGFGFLDPSAPCQATLDLDASGDYALVLGQPGAPHPGALGCVSVSQFINTTILVPIYEDILDDGTACGGPPGQNCYAVTGFAALHVVGMRFGGQWNGGDYSGCAANQDCIRGYFEREVTLAEGIELFGMGGSTDFGVTVVALSG